MGTFAHYVTQKSIRNLVNLVALYINFFFILWKVVHLLLNTKRGEGSKNYYSSNQIFLFSEQIMLHGEEVGVITEHNK